MNHYIEISDDQSVIIGQSKPIRKIFSEISRVARTDSTVLITGETGTGKELVAKAIHGQSNRCDRELVRLNCAALPAALLESELFGHEKGSFTGATHQRVGKFELANGGTIFLDEIGELNLELQAKILRVIQEKEFEKVGGNTLFKTDVRIIAATNRNLIREVRAGRFRKDLYYRLNVYPIHVPALRERKEDIILLINHFIAIKSNRMGKTVQKLSDAQIDQLTNYAWPGNVRELEHVLERAVISSDHHDFNLWLPEEGDNIHTKSKGVFTPRTYKETEYRLIIDTLKYCAGKIRGEDGAARILGLPPTTLESKMKRLGITRKMIF